MLARYDVKARFREGYSPFLGYTGFMVRGALGYSLKKLVCDDLSRRCSTCSLAAKCFYAYFFETSSTIKPDARLAVKGGRSGVTKPYTVTPVKVKGRALSFSITLFGRRALDAEPVIVASIISMGSRGLGIDPTLGDRRRFEVEEVVAVDPLNQTSRLVFSKYKGYIYSSEKARSYDLIEALKPKAEGLAAAKPSQVTLHLKTPTQLRAAGKPLHEPSFRSIIANLARKYSLLAHYHELGTPLKAEQAKKIIDAAAQAQLVEAKVTPIKLKKYSLEEGRIKGFGPFIKGTLTYKLPLTLWRSEHGVEILTLLLLGQLTGIGSLTTAGCGQYTLSFTLEG